MWKSSSCSSPKHCESVTAAVVTWDWSQVLWPFNDQCSHHLETSQLIFSANQLTGFYTMGKLVVKGLIVTNSGLRKSSLNKFTASAANLLESFWFILNFEQTTDFSPLQMFLFNKNYMLLLCKLQDSIWDM